MKKLKLNEIDNRYSEKENNVILIVEKQGLAAHPIKSDVYRICDYIDNFVFKNEPNGEKYVFDIPIDITKKIEWADDVLIKVEIINYNVDKEKEEEFILKNEGSGEGEFRIEPSDCLNNEKTKLEKIQFKLEGKSVNKRLVWSTIEPSLYHEFNHAYENLQRMLKTHKKQQETGEESVNSGGLFHNYDGGVLKRIAHFKKGDAIDNTFYSLWYRFMIPTELHAYATNLYGELETMDSENYREDLEKTKTYNDYLNYKQWVGYFKTLPLNRWKKWVKSINPNITSEYFKEWFIENIEYNLNVFFRKMGKIASLWYGDKNGYSLKEQILIIDGINTPESIRFKEILNYVENI